MSLAINTTLSGYAAAIKTISTAASNIANASSTTTTQNDITAKSPFVPQQVVASAQSNGGVIVQTVPANPASVSVNDPDNVAADSSGVTQYPNVDPAQQLVQANIASYDANANLSVIKVDNKNFQAILNIVS